MKRRSHPMKRGGVSPYKRKAKREYQYPEWVKQRRFPPREIQLQLDQACFAAARAVEQILKERRNGTSTY